MLSSLGFSMAAYFSFYPLVLLFPFTLISYKVHVHACTCTCIQYAYTYHNIVINFRKYNPFDSCIVFIVSQLPNAIL